MRQIKDCFKSTFGTLDGKTMLYWIADECGYFQTDTAKIKPELIAFFNKLLQVGEIAIPQKAGKLMAAYMDVANMNISKEEKDVLEV